MTQYDDRDLRATLYATQMEYSPTSAIGTDGSARRGTRRSGPRGMRSRRRKRAKCAGHPGRAQVPTPRSIECECGTYRGLGCRRRVRTETLTPTDPT